MRYWSAFSASPLEFAGNAAQLISFGLGMAIGLYFLFGSPGLSSRVAALCRPDENGPDGKRRDEAAPAER
jgi:hypothetical protein